MTVAILLAAGCGRRLGAELPKPLVEVGGEPLLLRLLEQCAAAGIDETIVVTGYGAETVARRCAARPGLRLVHNPDYARRGNARSLEVGLDVVGDRDVVKIDGDLLIHAAIVHRLVSAPGGSLCAIDRRGPFDEEAMLVRLRGDRITAMGKGLTRPDGASIGLERIDAGDLEAVRGALASVDGYYEDAYHALLREGWSLGAMEVRQPWTEIDTPADLERARARRW